jgi:redox-sensitive bicupin YhaK (pirin superfamily)
MIIVRNPQNIYRIDGEIKNGSFHGRRHFSFDQYHDPEYLQFGTLRVFNDDTLSPGAIWPLHPHRDIEVVTYCAEGEFRHEDEHGKGKILKKGWVQHTTVGSGMWHSEINNRPDIPMRFIQMWFLPFQRGLKPSVQQETVEKRDRTDRFLPLVSNDYPDTLPLFSEATVYSSFIQTGKTLSFRPRAGRGVYLSVLEGGPIKVNDRPVLALGAAKITEEKEVIVHAEKNAEILLIDVLLVLRKAS